MTLDEHHAHNMFVVAGNKHRVVTDKYSYGGLVGDLAKLDGFEDDRIPAIVADPVGLLCAALGGVGVPIEDGHDTIVAQDAFNSAICHGCHVKRVDADVLSEVDASVKGARSTVKVHFFDSHAHLSEGLSQNDRLRLIRPNTGSDIVIRAIHISSAGPSDWGALRSLPLISGLSLSFSLGIHPFALEEISPEQSDRHLAELSQICRDPPETFRAIGEFGLDFVRLSTRANRSRQCHIVRAHLQLARKRGLPSVVHCVRAHGALLELLGEAPTPPILFHSWSGSAELARQLSAKGHFISFSGALTLPNARRAMESARIVCARHMLIESDSPNQSPLRHRPAACRPEFIVDTARALATARGTTLDEVAHATFRNACRFFQLDASASPIQGPHR